MNRLKTLLAVIMFAVAGIMPLGCASGGSDQDIDNPPELTIEEADFIYWYRDMISASDAHPDYRRIPINSPSGQKAFNNLLEAAYFGQVTAEEFIWKATEWYPAYETSIRIIASYLPSAQQQQQIKENEQEFEGSGGR